MGLSANQQYQSIKYVVSLFYKCTAEFEKKWKRANKDNLLTTRLSEEVCTETDHCNGSVPSNVSLAHVCVYIIVQEVQKKKKVTQDRKKST